MARESVSALKDRMATAYLDALERAHTRAQAKLTDRPTEGSPYERVATRCHGLRSILVLAAKEKEDDELSGDFWAGLFYFMEQVTDDIKRDSELLWRQGRELWEEGLEAGRNESKAA